MQSFLCLTQSFPYVTQTQCSHFGTYLNINQAGLVMRIKRGLIGDVRENAFNIV